MKKNIVLKVNTLIPIFFGRFWLVVARDAYAARKQMKDVFGCYESGPFEALHSYNGIELGVFLYAGRITQRNLGHELFHFTHRLLDRCDISLRPDHSETHAYFSGWAHEWVGHELHKARIKVKTLPYSVTGK